MVGNITDLTEKDLGLAQNVEEKQIEDDNWTYVEGCKNPKAVTFLIRGGSQRVVDEVERAIHDAIMVVKDVIEKPYFVPGGGAPEEYLATKLRIWAPTLSGREQLVVERFAEALESIPISLARNAGMNAIDSITQLRSKQNSGDMYTGVDVINGTIGNIEKINVLEPLKVKEQIIKSAAETANMILRIDNVVAVSRTPSSPPSHMPEPTPGMY